MMRPVAIVAVLALVLVGVPAMAQQPTCGKHDVLVRYLLQENGGILRAVAITKNNFFIEWFVSPKGTWTELKTFPGGMTCITDSGHSWEAVKQGDAT